jgi:hypothetical protein
MIAKRSGRHNIAKSMITLALIPPIGDVDGRWTVPYVERREWSLP